MNYVEKLELLDLIADYIEYKIDDIQNVKYAYDYVNYIYLILNFLEFFKTFFSIY